MAMDPQTPAPNLKSPAVWLATGFGVGLLARGIPGSAGALLWGLPLAWAIEQLPGIAWQLIAIVGLNLIGVPLATWAGRALGGEKDNQAIVIDEITTVPLVFLFVPLVSWQVAVVGIVVHRIVDIIKPPPAAQLEQLPEGLGVMADDWMAGIYACAVFSGIAWLDRAAGWGFITSGG